MMLLIDGDQYLQKCCAATERAVGWDDDDQKWGNWVLASNDDEAWEILTGSINGLLHHFDTKDHVICLGTSPYFRHTLFPAYKAGRGRKPLSFQPLRERLKAEFKWREMPGLEADDIMGILATKPGNDCIIVAADKDMKTVPAKIWTGRDFSNVSEAEANYWHMFQTLTGDTTDGYKGCPGMGPVKAEKALDPGPAGFATTEMAFFWPRVVKAYEMKGLSEDDALLNARLARILRWSDWDTDKKEPILWTP
jgi:DNA polymerase-1